MNEDITAAILRCGDEAYIKKVVLFAVMYHRDWIKGTHIMEVFAQDDNFKNIQSDVNATLNSMGFNYTITKDEIMNTLWSQSSIAELKAELQEEQV